VLSYSRSEGLFFGVALDGSVISVDDKYNWSAYDQADLYASEIMEGKTRTVPPGAKEFTAALTRATQAASATAAPAAPAAAAGPAAPAEAPPSDVPPEDIAGDVAKTYPLEDSKPGAPPPP
jgi:hypothetical protein